jgi:uncharacterized damage-inducible protein DinB
MSPGGSDLLRRPRKKVGQISVGVDTDRGGFLRSILGTLNHLLVTDRMWLRRLKGNTPRAVDLGEILYEDFPDLAEART